MIMGAFIVLEGGEGSGKSTQARLLHQRLRREGVPAVLLHEPGGTTLGEQVRALLKAERRSSMSPLAELLLFSAARAQFVEDALQPALRQGLVVICDRFTPSTLAYQGYARGLSLETIEQLNKLTAGEATPDLILFLDIPPEEALHRYASQPSFNLNVDGQQAGEPVAPRVDEEGSQRFEKEPLSFHRKVHQGYLQMAQADPERWYVVDAALPVEEVAKAVWERVEKLVRGGVAS